MKLHKPFFIVLFVLFSPAAAATAQTVRLAAERSPHYLGEPALVRVVAEGFQEEPQPDCKVEAVSQGASVKLINVSPNVSEYVQSINGRVTRRRSVQFHFNFHVDVAKPGRYEIGPFVVTQGGLTKRTSKIELEFRDVEIDPQMRIELILPKNEVYPGQRIPVKIKWSYSGDVEAVQRLRIRSDLFDQFEFIDKPAPRRRGNGLPIQTTKEVIVVPAEVSEETVDGVKYTVLTAERTLAPNKSGRFEVAPITAAMRKVTRWRRGFFGDLEPAEVRPVRQVGSPLELTIKSLPTEGRPESFSGAVGNGFAVDVSANRTVVRVGDPISLRVMIRGDGNLQNIGLPSLAADGGMSPDQFRLPADDPPGAITDNRKEFTVDVRVLDQSVSEIPALAFSWFNPETEAYETARSKPIALRVHEAKIVSADDVVSSVKPPEKGAENPTPSETPSADQKPSVVASTLSADLSIVSDPSVLLRGRPWWSGPGVHLAFYLSGLLCVAITLLDRRRRNIDPAVLQRRRSVREQLARMEKSRKLPQNEAAVEMANAIRALVAQSPAARRDAQIGAEAERALAECEAAAFAPNAASASPLDEKLFERCLSLGKKLAKET